MTDGFRIEQDSMGELQVPEKALWGAQTQRAVQNFPISGLSMPRGFIRALGLIKWAAAGANAELGLMSSNKASVIQGVALQVAEGKYDEHFPIDVFQTGSGTSSNMNANEVIAKLATEKLGAVVHPNDDVNMGQSSNDVIPTAIHVGAALMIAEQLLPNLGYLKETLDDKASEYQEVIKTGRTHLMDAMPVSLAQELGGWSSQVGQAIERLEQSMVRLCCLAQGGTAVGTGINAHPNFGAKVAVLLSESSQLEFAPAANYLQALSSQDTAVEISGQLKTLAVSLMKIANDLRWMNSGPLAGLGEIALPALQPGSSIMPGKINPVIPEAVAMVAAHVIGNDAAITIAGQSGNFQLNVMLPLVAYNLLQSIQVLGTASQQLADKAIAGFTVNTDNLNQALERNPILVTAMNSVIGYDKGAAIAKKAYAEGRPVRDVAREMTDLSDEELDRLLDPTELTRGGIKT
ncbi:MAG: class II fumarate hydratase [Gammaproteobacteria bacterium]|jgi:fumarate hydratase class II|nr:aspartate ammonia-lyase [Chromatiales bacterium]MCP4927343.1 class II fumarate hydratase [Gammaproteobacteria bacterium]MDP7154220.1 class II fumarate hydratase [Gammaproteobacteria bacterium]MDP7296045.1 class II fumarate hydratase [Gammaproteobacteria bacterium]MDP7418633.1 class II fumarate hydratase [Gammaproteobacteria bacterium]